MVQGGVLFIAIAFSLINLLVDILYAYADPRISLSIKDTVSGRKSPQERQGKQHDTQRDDAAAAVVPNAKKLGFGCTGTKPLWWGWLSC